MISFVVKLLHKTAISVFLALLQQQIALIKYTVTSSWLKLLLLAPDFIHQ